MREGNSEFIYLGEGNHKTKKAGFEGGDENPQNHIKKAVSQKVMSSSHRVHNQFSQKRAKAMLRANDLKMINNTENPDGALSSKALKKQHPTVQKRPSSSYKEKQQSMHDHII